MYGRAGAWPSYLHACVWSQWMLGRCPPPADSVGAFLHACCCAGSVCVCLINAVVALIKCSHWILTRLLSFSCAAQWETRFKPSDIDPPTIPPTQYLYAHRSTHSFTCAYCRSLVGMHQVIHWGCLTQGWAIWPKMLSRLRLHDMRKICDMQ